jgi:SAM-dependent methyltransferase
MPQPELSIVAVAWGGEHNLPELVPSLRQALDGMLDDYDILVAGGPEHAYLADMTEALDATFVEAPGAGYGEILRAGLGRARGRYVMTMDADFSHRPGYVRTMWAQRDRAEVLIGSRYVPGAFAEMSWLRSILSRGLNFVYRKGLSLRIHDLSSGFRMYNREVLEDIGLPEGKGLDVVPEMIVKAACQGWQIAEVPFWYRGARPWTRARMTRLGSGYLTTLGRVLAQRNSVRAADYDHRAFDSWIPLQRYWQRQRFRIIQDFAPNSGWILDIGCGTSRIVQMLPQVVGMDVAIRKLRWLRSPGRDLIQASLTHIPFRDHAFNAVICSEVIEHIPRDRVDIGEMVRKIRPGGTLILSTPDYSRWVWRALEWAYGKVFPGGYVHEHINQYTNAGLRRELEELGLEVLDCRYVGGSEMIFKARVPLENMKEGPPERARRGAVGRERSPAPLTGRM